MTFTCIFVPEREFAYAWVAHAPNCIPLAPGSLLYFGAQYSLGMHNSRLEGGTSSDLGGVQTRNAFHGAGPLHLYKPYSDTINLESASKNTTL